MKRILDLALSVPAAVVSTPVIAALGLAVVATGGWPALIVQTRVGADERPIKVTKLRTMRRGVPVVAKSALPPASTAYTRLGPWLRRWSLDELPQIYNVIAGSMSIVGPRPALPSQHDLLALRRRHGVTVLKPGITGLAQIEGREALTLATKVRFESHYLRHMSLGYDLIIIARTFRAVLSRRGAF